MSRREIIWGESWINISMMQADAPRYIPTPDSGGRPAGGDMNDNELKDLANSL